MRGQERGERCPESFRPGGSTPNNRLERTGSTPAAQPEHYAAQSLAMKREPLVVIAVVLLALVCTAGAAWTVYWSLRFGLTPRAPLSNFQTVVRFVLVTCAAILLPFRRDWIERMTLLCAIVAAGSSALFGLGFRSTTLDVIRLLFHFLAYSLGGFVCIRWLAPLWHRRSTVRAA